jgi:hypothetical protein
MLGGILLLSCPGMASGDEKNDREEAVERVDAYASFDMNKIKKTVKIFLESKTVADRAKLVRQPDRVKPLMTRFYGGEKIAAEGFDSLKMNEISYRDCFLTSQVTTENFLTNPIAIERVGEGENATYLVDWESWVGFCDLKPKEMHAKRPVTPIVMRAIISAESYFNYGFSDESKWSPYKLELRDPEFVFYGYTKKGSEADKDLATLQKKKTKSPYLVKVAYPEGAKSKNQVEIVKVITAGWIRKEAPKKEED